MEMDSCLCCASPKHLWDSKSPSGQYSYGIWEQNSKTSLLANFQIAAKTRWLNFVQWLGFFFIKTLISQYICSDFENNNNNTKKQNQKTTTKKTTTTKKKQKKTKNKENKQANIFSHFSLKH